MASVRALDAVVKSGHIFVDDAGLIMKEYRRNLEGSGPPGPGRAFFRWLLTHEWGGTKVTRVALTPRAGDSHDFKELPKPTDGTVYDPSDRKFLAVAATHHERPPILQAVDSKWWGWRNALQEIGVEIHFLCETEIKRKYHEKMG